MSESIANGRISETAEESDVPPMVSCALCRRPDCPGCGVLTAPSEPKAAALAWEGGRGYWLKRLWLTALASSTEPHKTFGELPEGSVAPALTFALLAETLALASVASALAIAALAVAPEFSLPILLTPVFLAAGLASLFALALLMVLLHVLWGLCIELGALTTGGRARFGQGLRFGMYACGWDLVTSPAGIIGGLVSRGLLGAWGPIVQAARVPRRALRAYVEDYRQLAPAAQRRGLLLSVGVLGTLCLSLLFAVVLALYHFAQALGY
jgi:hypothetical protein